MAVKNQSKKKVSPVKPREKSNKKSHVAEGETQEKKKSILKVTQDDTRITINLVKAPCDNSTSNDVTSSPIDTQTQKKCKINVEEEDELNNTQTIDTRKSFSCCLPILNCPLQNSRKQSSKKVKIKLDADVKKKIDTSTENWAHPVLLSADSKVDNGVKKSRSTTKMLIDNYNQLKNRICNSSVKVEAPLLKSSTIQIVDRPIELDKSAFHTTEMGVNTDISMIKPSSSAYNLPNKQNTFRKKKNKHADCASSLVEAEGFSKPLIEMPSDSTIHNINRSSTSTSVMTSTPSRRPSAKVAGAAAVSSAKFHPTLLPALTLLCKETSKLTMSTTTFLQTPTSHSSATPVASNDDDEEEDEEIEVVVKPSTSYRISSRFSATSVSDNGYDDDTLSHNSKFLFKRNDPRFIMISDNDFNSLSTSEDTGSDCMRSPSKRTSLQPLTKQPLHDFTCPKRSKLELMTLKLKSSEYEKSRSKVLDSTKSYRNSSTIEYTVCDRIKNTTRLSHKRAPENLAFAKLYKRSSAGQSSDETVSDELTKVEEEDEEISPKISKEKRGILDNSSSSDEKNDDKIRFRVDRLRRPHSAFAYEDCTNSNVSSSNSFSKFERPQKSPLSDLLVDRKFKLRQQQSLTCHYQRARTSVNTNEVPLDRESYVLYKNATKNNNSTSKSHQNTDEHRSKSPIRFPFKTKREKYLNELIASYAMNKSNKHFPMPNHYSNSSRYSNNLMASTRSRNERTAYCRASAMPSISNFMSPNRPKSTSTTYTKADKYLIHYPISSNGASSSTSSAKDFETSTVKLNSYKLMN